MTKKNSIAILQHKQCCGCRACGDVCPKTCISFEKDTEGFYYPSIAENKCIDCGKCTKVCPELNITKNDTICSVSLAGYAKDLTHHLQGSSGGYFGLLAEYVINNGGIVYGAAFDENLKVIHISAMTKEQLLPLYKSKYVQSNLQGVYKSIKQNLETGRCVLFCGTPCQCNAVRNFCRNRNENLYLVDFICHGVPSQELFDESIRWIEKENGIKVIKFTFRYKDGDTTNPRSYGMEYIKNGQLIKKQGLYHDIPFYYGFQQYLFLRPSCYNCKWCSINRSSDITLGDYWGISKVDKTFDEHRGVSLLLFNTEKGKKIAQSIGMDDTFYYKEFPSDLAIMNNASLSKCTKLSPTRAQFFDDYQSQGFNFVVDKYLTPRFSFLWKHYYNLPKIIRVLINKI